MPVAPAGARSIPPHFSLCHEIKVCEAATKKARVSERLTCFWPDGQNDYFHLRRRANFTATSGILVSIRYAPPSTVHPRACRERGATGPSRSVCHGPSPLVRGTQTALMPSPYGMRFIPAAKPQNLTNSPAFYRLKQPSANVS